MVEKNLVKCNGECQSLQYRIQDGKFASGNKRWRDENGLLWSGKTCGKCNQLRLNKTMKAKREHKIT